MTPVKNPGIQSKEVIDLAFRRGWVKPWNNRPRTKPRYKEELPKKSAEDDKNLNWSEAGLKPRPKRTDIGHFKVIKGLPLWLQKLNQKRAEKRSLDK